MIARIRHPFSSLLLSLACVCAGHSFAEEPSAPGTSRSIDQLLLEQLSGGSSSEYFPPSFERFSLVEARWGAADGWIEVTPKLQDKVKNGRLFVPDLRPVLAEAEDPKSGHQKALVVVYQHNGKARLAIIPTIAGEGRGGKLLLPEPDPKQTAEVQAFRKKLVGTKWLIAKEGRILFFEEDQYGVADQGERRGVWMAAGPYRVGAVDGEGAHHDIEFDRDLSSGVLTVDGKFHSKLTRLPADGQIPVMAPASDSLRGPLFESVLGTYGKALRGKRHSYVTLRPPQQDLWTPEIEAKLKGSLSYEQVDYIGTAKLVIPETGLYVIDVPESGTQLRLNNVLMAAGVVKLRKGAYEVEIYTNHWGQPYLKYAFARVFTKEPKTQIPFVNTGEALEKFLAQKIQGNAVSQVCEFRTRRVDTPGKEVKKRQR